MIDTLRILCKHKELLWPPSEYLLRLIFQEGEENSEQRASLMYVKIMKRLMIKVDKYCQIVYFINTL
jgi:hypothetical protein